MDCPAPSGITATIGDLKRIYDQAARLARIGAWECDLDTEALTWTEGVYDLFDLPRSSEVCRTAIVDLYEDESRRQMERLRAAAIRTGTGFTLDARIRTRRGASRWMRLTADVAYEDGRPVRLFGAKQDITDEKARWDALRQRADHDPLTGLANRGSFEERFNAAARCGETTSLALALIDLDGFKQINDGLGHAAGDECLRQVAGRLRRAFKDAVVVARLGGDEFAVLLRAAADHDRVLDGIERAQRGLGRPIVWRDRTIEVRATVGVTFRKPQDRRDLGRLLEDADRALYDAKAADGDCVRVVQEQPGLSPGSMWLSPG